MTNTTTTSTTNHSTSKAPSHVAYQVRDREGGKGFWTRIGAAWPHADGKGFNLQLDVVPLDGRVPPRRIGAQGLTPTLTPLSLPHRWTRRHAEGGHAGGARLRLRGRAGTAPSANATRTTATTPTTATTAAPTIARVPLTTRIREDLGKALKRASLERQLAGVEPSTLQEILEEAIEPWLRSNGYLS